MWPVIIRELRAGSRHRTTYGLRVLAAAAVMAAAFAAWLDNQTVLNQGAPFFQRMHVSLLAAMWVFVPMMAADCISREKRENTLGLLFLTPLKAREIVLAKTAVHALRALTLWAAIIPVLAVAFLLGGVTWQHVVISIALNFSALWLSLSAAVIASALSKGWARSLSLSFLFSIFGLVVFALFLHVLTGGAPEISVRAVAWGLLVAIDPGITGGPFTVTGGPLTVVPFFTFAGLSLLLSYLGARCAARLMQRRWQEAPKSRTREEVERIFLAPRFLVSCLRRWMRHTLEHNPIGWLEHRSWSGRMVAWVWFAIMISFLSVLSAEVANLFRGMHFLFLSAWLLVVSMAFVSAASFRRERETGALELILVTPLTPREIILGRLKGIWGQFLPALLAWLAVVTYLTVGLPGVEFGHAARLRSLILIGVAFVTIPVIGLYFSLAWKSVILGWLATLTLGILIPQLFPFGFVWNVRNPEVQVLTFTMTELLVALFLGKRLHARLVQRTFRLQS